MLEAAWSHSRHQSAGGTYKKCEFHWESGALKLNLLLSLLYLLLKLNLLLYQGLTDECDLIDRLTVK